MKKTLLSLAAVAALSGSVMAGGDIAPVEPAPMDSWSGFYVGAQAGYVWGDFDTTTSVSTTIQDVSGFEGGLYTGYNVLLDNNVLLGVEGDINWVNADSTLNNITVEENWNASLRARLGMVLSDSWMPYLTGGVAWSNVDLKTSTFSATSQYLTGWTAGVGVEYKITENLHAKLEWRYTDYGSKTINGVKVEANQRPSYTLGISYRF